MTRRLALCVPLAWAALLPKIAPELAGLADPHDGEWDLAIPRLRECAGREFAGYRGTLAP
jgi:hypothetical protein